MPALKHTLILSSGAVFLFLILGGRAYAQKQQEQSEKRKEKPNKELQAHIKHVRTATIMSAALPGLGQIYNKKYWKAPFVYAGAAALIYFIDSNNDKYNYYKALYVNVDAPGPVHFYDLEQYQGYSDEQLKEAFKGYMEDYRRWRDLNVIGLALLYVANIVDAHVDAYFMNYDISEDLSMDVSPTLFETPGRNYFTSKHPGISIKFNF